MIFCPQNYLLEKESVFNQTCASVVVNTCPGFFLKICVPHRSFCAVIEEKRVLTIINSKRLNEKPVSEGKHYMFSNAAVSLRKSKKKNQNSINTNDWLYLLIQEEKAPKHLLVYNSVSFIMSRAELLNYKGINWKFVCMFINLLTWSYDGPVLKPIASVQHEKQLILFCWWNPQLANIATLIL